MYIKDEELGKILEKAYVYASMNYDLNQKDNKKLADYVKIYEKYSEVVNFAKAVGMR